MFGGNARVTLEATFTGDAEELRVTFRSIRLVLFGNQIFEKDFPPGVERTWCLSYNDASCRVVRAGVDAVDQSSAGQRVVETARGFQALRRYEYSHAAARSISSE